MKLKLLLLLLLSVLSFTSCKSQNSTAESQNAVNKKTSAAADKTPVLIELFTSEGCSSCPPADRALAFFEQQPIAQAEIIALALHVDYWNRLGWADEFSSPLYSQRQELYAQRFKQTDVYTPQMVVDGSEQFTGSDTGKATKAITEAAKAAKATIELSVAAGEKLKIKIFNLPEHENSTVFLAISEDGLISNVKRGENSGKTLEHVSVARELKAIGNVNAQDKAFEAETIFQIQPNWKKENLKLVVFVQGNANRKIYGVKRIPAGKSENPA